ncbi:MAG: hypothetical protein JKY31_06395 [Rhodobacteraceae bacterium]|nr:hypothetical protein [Paracoccaceae bacterium]
MVSYDEVLARARKLFEDFDQVARVIGPRTKGKIADNPKIIVMTNSLTHVADQGQIHLFNGRKGSITKLHHIFMPEMSVGCVLGIIHTGISEDQFPSSQLIKQAANLVRG